VGTVEDARNVKSTSVVPTGAKIEFEGISHAISVANDKVEVYFKEAFGGSDLYFYRVSIGGGDNDVNISSQILYPDHLGFLRYTITGLNPGITYKIGMSVVDQEDENTFSNPDIIAEAKTFENDVCDFSGVSLLENLPGPDGLDSIKINWAEPFLGGDNLGSIPGSTPEQIEVVLLSSLLYSPDDFDNVTLNNGVGRYTFWIDYDETISSYIARGLDKKTNYFTRVRCIHKDTVVDYTKPWLKSEMNNKYLQKGTLSDDLSLIEYDPDKIFLKKANGANVTNQFDVTWTGISGVFDHFRLYYGTAPTFNIGDSCVTNVIENGVYCKKMKFTDTSVSVKTPTSSDYNVRFVVCQDVVCSPDKHIILKEFAYENISEIAPFLGIEDISFAKKVNELGTVTLEFTKPSLAQGSFDGFIIEHKSALADTSVDISDSGYPGGLIIESYNHLDVSSIIIKNVPYNIQSCFSVTLYVLDQNDDRVPGQEVPLFNCKTPIVVPPSKTIFTGLTSADLIRSDVGSGGDAYSVSQLMLNFNEPTQGVYEEYEVYILTDDNLVFDFATAIDETSVGDFSHYQKVTIANGFTSANIGNLTADNQLSVGILTHYQDNTGSFRSVFNSAIFTCLIPALPGPLACLPNQ